MRILVLMLASLGFAPIAHAGVQAEVATMRQKVKATFSAAAVKRFDRGVKIGTPKSGASEVDLSGNGSTRVMLRGDKGVSLTHDVTPSQHQESAFAQRISDGGKSTILRQPGMTIQGKTLAINDTVSKMTKSGTRTEGVFYKERSLLGKLLRIESTTRYHADVDSNQQSTTRIVSDKRRLVVGGLRIPLPSSGEQTIAAMYGK